jgi:hypothetical protein
MSFTKVWSWRGGNAGLPGDSANSAPEIVASSVSPRTPVECCVAKFFMAFKQGLGPAGDAFKPPRR